MSLFLKNSSSRKKRSYLSYKSSVEPRVPRSEILLIFSITICFYLTATFLDFNERWLEWSAQYERYELDELPLGFSILALGLSWFIWRRWRLLSKTNNKLLHVQKALLREIEQRKRAEAKEKKSRQKLEKVIAQQHRQAASSRAIQDMSDLLMSAQNQQEILTLVVRCLKQILPNYSGAVLKFEEPSLLAIKTWGNLNSSDFTGNAEYKCWGIRRGGIYNETAADQRSLCAYLSANQQVLCAPILTPRGVWGSLHLRMTLSPDSAKAVLGSNQDEILTIIKVVTDNVGLHIHNLNLKNQLIQEAIRDPLTMVLNRRGLKQHIRQANLFKDHRTVCSVLLLDVDHFKQFNDRFGHDVGDEALVKIAKIINELIRNQDVFCRHGGEEFLLLLPNMNKDIALSRAGKICTAIQQTSISIGHGQIETITVSIGLAAYPEDAENYDDLIAQADQALYKAKQSGRNCVVAYSIG